MTWAIDDAIRTAHIEAIRDAIDAGSAGGKLKVYDGTQPAKGAAVTTQTLLVVFTLADPSMSSVTTGVGTWDLDPDISATCETFSGTKTATWCRATDSDDTFVMDGTVGATGSGADCTLSSTSLESAQTVKLTTGTLTAGNA